MQIKAKLRDTRLRYYGPGKTQIIQPGEISIDIEDQVLQAMVQQAIAQSAYLPVSGGSLSGNLTLSDVNIILGTTTGTKIGTATSQKLAFFNATPIIQPSATGQTAGFTAGSGSATKDDSTFTGGTGSKAYTIGDIVKHLKNLGLIASS